MWSPDVLATRSSKHLQAALTARVPNLYRTGRAVDTSQECSGRVQSSTLLVSYCSIPGRQAFLLKQRKRKLCPKQATHARITAARSSEPQDGSLSQDGYPEQWACSLRFVALSHQDAKSLGNGELDSPSCYSGSEQYSTETWPVGRIWDKSETALC